MSHVQLFRMQNIKLSVKKFSYILGTYLYIVKLCYIRVKFKKKEVVKRFAVPTTGIEFTLSISN